MAVTKNKISGVGTLIWLLCTKLSTAFSPFHFNFRQKHAVTAKGIFDTMKNPFEHIQNPFESVSNPLEEACALGKGVTVLNLQVQKLCSYKLF